MGDPPGRETRPARSARRSSWYGLGKTTTVEKDGVGRFIDDLVYAFADVSLAGLPVLWHVATTATNRYAGVKTAALVAWTTMVVGAAAIRGGWVTPLGTSVPGWVSVTPLLVVFRVFYFGVALAVAAYGGGALAVELALPLESVTFAATVAALAVGAFPRFAEEYYRVASAYVDAWKARPR